MHGFYLFFGYNVDFFISDIINSTAASKYFSTVVKDKEQLGMLQLTVNTNLYSSSTTPLTTTTFFNNNNNNNKKFQRHSMTAWWRESKVQ